MLLRKKKSTDADEKKSVKDGLLKNPICLVDQKHMKQCTEKECMRGYIVVGEMGQGAFGRVFKVKHESSKHEYALKFLRFVDGIYDLDKFNQEVQITKQISETKLGGPQVIDAWICQGTRETKSSKNFKQLFGFMVMSIVPGLTVQHFLRKYHDSLQEVKGLLETLRKKWLKAGFDHPDLSHANVLIDFAIDPTTQKPINLVLTAIDFANVTKL